MKYEDLVFGSKVTNKLGLTITVEMKTELGLYTSQWNKPLKSPERLFLLESIVHDQINKGERTLLDWKIRISKKDLNAIALTKYGATIEEFTQTAITKETILAHGLQKWDVVYIDTTDKALVFDKYDETNIYFNITTEAGVCNITMPKENAGLLNGSLSKTIPLIDIAEKEYGMKDVNIFIFTD